MTSSDVWTAEQAQRYDRSDGVFNPEAVGPVVDALAAWAAEGPALEFAIGTGRIAVPLLSKGVAVSGIELSRPMMEQLRTKVSESQVPVVLRDMATTRVPGEFSVVYLVFNTIGNLRTQAEQVECFRNAARQLPPGGRFVVEVGVLRCGSWFPGKLWWPSTWGTSTSASTPSIRSPGRRPPITCSCNPMGPTGAGRTTIGTSGPGSSISWPSSPAWSWNSAPAMEVWSVPRLLVKAP